MHGCYSILDAEERGTALSELGSKITALHVELTISNILSAHPACSTNHDEKEHFTYAPLICAIAYLSTTDRP